MADRPDQIGRATVHVVYVVPKGGADHHLDTNGTITNSFAAAQAFLRDISGRRLRTDTYQGALDVSFLRLSITDTEATAFGAFIREQIEADLIRAGFDDPGKILLVYYDGGNTTACGSGAWPPLLPGTVGALYLHGTPAGFGTCDTNALAGAGQPAGYFEHSLIHEAFHLMGVVPTCAPHETENGHVSDSPHDLMYRGPEPWMPDSLDVGHDDYFRADVPGCPDASDNPYLAVAP